MSPYADFVMQIDHREGKLNALLDQLNIAENTIVIFNSENGYSPEAKFDILAEKGHNPSGIFRRHKADVFEGGLRVPFVLKGPKKYKRVLFRIKLFVLTIC